MVCVGEIKNTCYTYHSYFFETFTEYPKEEKSNFFIPTVTLFILHISGITLFFPTKIFIKNYNPIALLGTDSFVPVA